MAIQPFLLMALQLKVLYCAFCKPVGNLRMYSLLLTRCCVNQLGGLSHTQLRTVFSFCMECGGGRGFAWTVYDESANTTSSKTLMTLVTARLDVQNITYSHLGATFMFTMPSRFSFAEYADMIYVYGFCDGNLVHAVAEYQKRFSNRTSRVFLI